MDRTELNKRRQLVRQMHANGIPTVNIAKQIGCSFGTVYNDLKFMRLKSISDKPNLIVCRNLSKVHDIYISLKGDRGWKQRVSDALGVDRKVVYLWCEKNTDTLQQWRSELTSKVPPSNWREVIESRKRQK